MHFRNRSPGNGYRGHSMGVSPDSSVRGNEFRSNGGGYSHEFRSYNRGGFGRGQSRQFSRPPAPPLPPQRNGGNDGGGAAAADIFMEAGKLAAEYLISKGFLPANALSGKWQNGKLKSLAGGQEGVGRASVMSRLGEAVSDSGPSRKRYGDENSNSVGARSISGRKRNGSFKNNGSEWNREMVRSGSWSERSRAASAEGDDDSDRFSQNSASNVIGGQERNVPRDPRLSSERLKTGKDAGTKESSSPSQEVSGKEAVELDNKKVYQNGGKKDEMQVEKRKDEMQEEERRKDEMQVEERRIDEMQVEERRREEMQVEERRKEEMQVEERKDDVAVMVSSDEGNLASDNSSDLLSFCRFVKIPTRTRSSMAARGSKIDTHPLIVDGNAQKGEDGPSKEPLTLIEDLTVSNLSTDGLPNQMNDSEVVGFNRLEVPSPEKELVEGSSTVSASSPVKSPVKNPELPDFEMITVMTKEHGEKRALDEDNTFLGNKRPRESGPSEDADPNSVVVKSLVTEELMTSEDPPNIFPSDEKRLLDVSLFPKIEIETGSFKTCDLNLMEAAESNGTHDLNPNAVFPSVTENGKQPISVDIDLSMHNNSRASNMYGRCSIDGKDIEVIDLESDSMPDHGDLINSDGRADNAFNGLDGFPSDAPNASEIPDSSEGYGLMISELMGNDISSSSVTADVNGLHNDMGLDNGQEILGDDDPIYMSLGEIPLSFLRVWEQPTQEYGKPPF